MTWTFRRIDGRKEPRDGMGYVEDEQGRDILHVGERTLSEAENVAIGNLAAAAPKLLAACVAMLGYMENGFLIRNTRHDMDDDWALKALPFVKDVQDMHSAVAEATGGTK